MRKGNSLGKNSNRQKKTLILVSEDKNQLQKPQNKQPLTNSRQDRDIVSNIQHKNYEAVETIIRQHYFESLAEQLQSIFPFFEAQDIERSFLRGISDVIKKVEELLADLEEGQEVEHFPVQERLDEYAIAYSKTLVTPKDKNKEDYLAIKALMQNNNRGFTLAYDRYRAKFLAFGKAKFPSCGEETVKGVYQDVMIVLIEDYIRTGKIRVKEDWIIGLRKETKLMTFILAIGRRMLARKCNSPIFGISEEEERKLEAKSEEMKDNSNEEALMGCIKQLSERCKKLLYYKYWLGLSYEEIREITNARSAGSVRVMTMRCRDSLRNCLEKKKD